MYNYGATLCELCYKIIMIGQYLITTSSCNKVVFIANCNIRYLSLMSSQSGKKSTIFTGPDFNQAVISTLRDNSNMNKFLLSPAASFVITKWEGLGSTKHELSLAEEQAKWRILFLQARRIPLVCEGFSQFAYSVLSSFTSMSIGLL